jgi:hypothetical protein
MMIVCSSEGQLCNRLFHFSHFLVNSIEYKIPLWYPFFDEYSKYFKVINSGKFLEDNRISIKITIFYRLLFLTLKFLPKFRLFLLEHVKATSLINLSDSLIMNSSVNGVMLASGWHFRDFQNFKKHSDIIKFVFSFDKIIIRDADTIISNLRNNEDITIVGVHIRRGDYKEFRGGKFYYEDEVYVDKMRQFETLMYNENRRVIFIICSNDASVLQSKLLRKHRNCIQSRSEIEDLCLLSKCDFLIGPPSTFTMWASFYGGIPLLQIEDKDQTVDLCNFNVNCG